MTRAFAAIGVATLALHIWWLPMQVHAPTQGDADVYQQAAARLVAGLPVYGTWARARLDQPPGAFIYPPTALVLLKPFAGVSNEAFRWGWYMTLIVAFWALAAALAKLVRGSVTIVNTLVVGAVLQVVPGVSSVMLLGNADLIIWALVAWAFAAPRAAGWLVGIGAALKLFPIVLAIAWFLRTPRRFAEQLGWVFGVSVAATVLVVGRDAVYGWITIGLPALRDGVFPPGNFSLAAVFAHLLFIRDMTGPLPPAAHVFLALFPPLATVVTLWTARELSTAKYGAVVLVVTVLVAPICWWWRLSIGVTLAVAVWIHERRETSCDTASSSESLLA